MRILYVTRHFNHSGYIILEKLLEENFNIVGILLKDEKSQFKLPVVRWFYILKYWFKCTYYRCKPLKTIKSEEILAKKNGLNIIKAKSIKSNEFYEKLKQLKPDIIVLGGGWHELIPDRVFKFPKLGCINTHPSLLPEFRGTSITRWQVLHGVTSSGSTIHYVDEKFDTGGVLAQKAVTVDHLTSPQELFYKLAVAGAEIMVPLLRSFELSGKQEPFYIDHNEKYYKYFKRWEWQEEKLEINWNEDFRNIHFFVLANIQESYEYLGPIFNLGDKKYFLRKTNIVDKEIFNGDINNIELLANNIHVVSINKGSIFLYRKDEKYVLELVQVQVFDRNHQINRAKAAAKIVSLKVGDIFKKFE